MTDDVTLTLHAEQFARWGWRDMRRKTANQSVSPCYINVKGRCGRVECCLRWTENPKNSTDEQSQKSPLCHD